MSTSPKIRAKLNRLARAVSANLSYNLEAKVEFHAAAKAVLREVALALGYPTADGLIRANLAGIACSGEVYLHTEGLYIQLDRGLTFDTQDGKKFMFRSVVSKADYTGGRNRWMTYSNLVNGFAGAVAEFKQALEDGRVSAENSRLRAVYAASRQAQVA